MITEFAMPSFHQQEEAAYRWSSISHTSSRQALVGRARNLLEMTGYVILWGMRARLSWRLLLVPRLIIALGVIIWAVIVVSLTRQREPSQPVRMSPISDDPVADVLADARPVSRNADEELDVNDLRWIVDVAELKVVDEDACNTVVGLDDAVASYADVYADGLADALAAQPGIDAVEHVDREAVLVRSLLSLPDVQAAAIRALLVINRDPQAPRERPLRAAAMNAIADSVAAVMAGHGFTGRLRMSPGHDESHIDLNSRHGPGFYRLLAEECLVQVLGLSSGYGYHNDDGTITDAHIVLTVALVEIAANGVAESVELDGCEVVAGERILSVSHDWLPATVDGIKHILVSKALPLCESTTSRAAIVDRWVRGLPWHVPDKHSREAADVAERWGFHKHARDLLTYHN